MDQRLDFCTPTAQRREPGSIFIHSGGFTTGNRNQMLGDCNLLVQGGFPSISITYRLTSDGHAYLVGATFRAASLLPQVSLGDRPGFFFHDKTDRLVPVSQSVLIANALKAARVKVLFRTFENTGHGVMLPTKHLEHSCA